ncbi:MAG TPA: helix-turn-helix domain-containing protein [Solirubrobacterales bacterium]|nr:helix-turn-helix domain-containing protein [Solirubrobacterales bacterium]
MAGGAVRARRSEDQARAVLRERLEARREEIEAAALTRVGAIADPSEVSDPTYAEGLRAAVSAAIAYGIETTGREGRDPPIPVALLAQARVAARVGIPLDTVLRRYFAGYSLLGYFILEEASNAAIADGAELQRLLGSHAGIFDRLLAAVAEEHTREAGAVRASAERRHAKRIERALAGEPVGAAELPYDFDQWHLGVLSVGPPAERLLRETASRLDCRLLLLRREEGVVWAWFGARRPLSPAGVLDGPASREGGLTLALGEPAEGLSGWRLTHRQAKATLALALRSRRRLVRYADVALLASVHRDDLLATSLRRLYLEPLETGGERGKTLRVTLRAFIDAGRNASSAAAALGTRRQTVTARVREVESLLGVSVDACLGELELALRLEELETSVS